jgi:hypothetical protein
VRTALVLPIPEAEALVGEWRKLHDPSAKDGMPAHVTVLYPFRDSEKIDAACIKRLENVCGGTESFELIFAKADRFPGVRWLAPEPRAPIDALTRMLSAEFPYCKPYGGAIVDPIPHLTFAIGDDAAIDEVERAVKTALVQPIRSRVTQCVLFALTAEGWRKQLQFRFR